MTSETTQPPAKNTAPAMIPVCEPVLLGNEKKYVMDCLETGWVSSLGKYIPLFEENFSRYIGVGHGVACSSATTGLHMALEVLGIGPGDEVIIPNFTIIVSANVVILAGAKPVLVDVEPDTWCIDPAKIEAAITRRTKAIMVVHMYGHPCDMDPIGAVAKKHGLFVIEDCSQSHGATCKGKMTGSFSDIAVFSFYGNKILTTGEGGMLVTDEAKYADKARRFRDNGFQIPRFIHETRGMNYRLTNMQAAMGLAQTEKAEYAVEKKRENARIYMRELEGFEHVALPVERPWARNVYWMFCVLVNDSFGMTKENIMAALKEKGVDTRSFFYPMSQQPAYRGNSDPRMPDTSGHWPVSDDLARRGFYLPSGLGLTEEQIVYCARALKSLGK
jgi:perosamine synthetase